MTPSQGRAHIGRLDFNSDQARRPLLRESASPSSSLRHSHDTSQEGSVFDQVAERLQDRDRRKFSRELRRYGSFAWALLNCLCAGSITAFSLYGHLFQSRLNYSQYQVNTVAIAAELAMYLPVSGFGFLCDRYGPGPLSLGSAVFFGFGYLMAAGAYRSGPPSANGGDGWPFGVMILAFVTIGMGTCSMYLSAVTTCAKNFGRGNHKGAALAIPIAAFGLSGMWLSQVGSRIFQEVNGVKTELDVSRFFVFMGFTFLAVGIVGSVVLKVVDEDELIDEAVESLARSGLLSDSEFFQRAADHHGYGTMEDANLSDSQVDFLRSEAENMKLREAEERRKKTWLLNAETRRFLSDRTMWWLAGGFFLVTGPGEAFINNVGTIIGTLYPPPSTSQSGIEMTNAATHVSVIAVTSTVARIFAGTLSDLLAPPSTTHHLSRPSTAAASAPQSPAIGLSRSTSSYFQRKRPWHLRLLPNRPIHVSRMTFLLSFSLLLSLGQVLLASGAMQDHGSSFWIVSALVGLGYGAAFSLVPIVISVVWGVENFGTNWGVVAMMPAAGAAVWGFIYSAVYQAATVESGPGAGAGSQINEYPGGSFAITTSHELCHGTKCYAPTFWAMAACIWLACGLWTWAWRGPDGWSARGIAV